MIWQIRRFDEKEKTVAYAKMLETAGAYLVAVHGRTREQKTAKEVRADWDAIKVNLAPLTCCQSKASECILACCCACFLSLSSALHSL